jgi:hypothetical protein
VDVTVSNASVTSPTHAGDQFTYNAPEGGKTGIRCEGAHGCSAVEIDGAVAVTVSCAKGSDGCSGTATITILTPPTIASDATASKKKTHKPQQTTLGKLHFLLAPGHTKVLHIRMNAAARRLLKAHHNRLQANLTIATGSRKTVRRITITAPTHGGSKNVARSVLRESVRATGFSAGHRAAVLHPQADPKPASRGPRRVNESTT